METSMAALPSLSSPLPGNIRDRLEGVVENAEILFGQVKGGQNSEIGNIAESSD